MKCANCDAEIRDDLKFCPGCGGKIIPPAPPKPVQLAKDKFQATLKTGWKPFIWVVVLLSLFGGAYYVYTSYKMQAEFKYGRHSYMIGEYRKCSDRLERVTARMPRMDQAWVTLAECYEEQGLNKRTVSTLEKALRWNKESPGLYAMMGRIYYKKNDLKNAKDMLLKAVKREPKNRIANQYLGYIFLKEKNKEKAISSLNISLKGASGTDRIAINKTLGDIYFSQKKYDSAEQSFLVVQKDDINDIDTALKLIETYLKLNKYNNARVEIDRVTLIDPESDSLKKRKEEVYEMVRLMEAIDYIKKRKVYDNSFLQIYSLLENYIGRVNINPNAFIGKLDDQELLELLDASEGLLRSYQAIKVPGDYYLVHTQSMSAVSMFTDTIQTLQNYIKSGDPNQYRSLSVQLVALKEMMNKMVAMWKNESDKMNIPAIMKSESSKPGADAGKSTAKQK
ncbi:MAG: tetratricopeptide repeat protein [bacterium]